MGAIRELKRFQTVVLRDTSATDLDQIAASGATVNVYKQGATVSASTSIGFGGSGAIAVYDSGPIIVGDTIQVGTTATQTGTVTAVSNTSLTVTNTSATTLTVSIGNRLIVTSARPTLYTDNQGTVSTANPITLGSSGTLAFYTTIPQFDYIVSGTGLTSAIYVDNDSGWIGNILVATDYASIQAAVDNVPSTGGVVYIPAGTYTPSSVPSFTPPLLFPKDRPVHLTGAGREITFLTATSAGYINVNLIEMRGNYSTIEDLTLTGPGAVGSGRGIQVGRVAADDTGDVCKWTTIKNVRILNTAAYGIAYYGSATTSGLFTGEDGPKTAVGANSLCIYSLVDNCSVTSPASKGGIKLGWANTTITIRKTAVEGWVSGPGIYLLSCEQCQIEDSSLASNSADLYNVVFDRSFGCSITNTYFENSVTVPTKHYIITNDICWNITVAGCNFNRIAAAGYCKFIYNAPKAMSTIISNCLGFTAGTPVGTDHISQDTPDATYHGGIVLLGTSLLNYTAAATPIPMSVSLAGAASKWSAGLTSTILHLPNISTADRDSAAVLPQKNVGDVIHNRSPKGVPEFWDGVKWHPLGIPIMTWANVLAETTAGALSEGDRVYITDLGGAAIFQNVRTVWRIQAGTPMTTAQSTDTAIFAWQTNGDMVYDTDLAKFKGRQAGAWVNFGAMV